MIFADVGDHASRHSWRNIWHGNLVLCLANEESDDLQPAQQAMKPIANRIAALNAKIDRARQLVAEHQQGADARDNKASNVLIHDLTHCLHSLEARRENLLLQSRLMAQRKRDVA